MLTRLKCLRRADQGAAATEFGIIAPVFIAMLLGMFDVGHTMYTTAMLQGTMEKAGRDFTLENAKSTQTIVEPWVRGRVQSIVKSATVTFERKAYFDFGDVEQPEEYTDENGNGVCDNDETFEDDNGNGQWDPDKGEAGFGGARDAVLLVAKVEYDRVLPVSKLVGLPQKVQLTATTVLRNQPFDDQDLTVKTGKCDR